MKETIEAWAVYRNGDIMNYFDLKEDAEADVFHHGGTVVRLTGEMPRKPIERKTVAWVGWCDPNENCTTRDGRLGIADAWWHKTESCQTKVEITVKELSDEL